MNSAFTWVATAAGIGAVLVVAIVIGNAWSALGASEISLAGWLAMIFGVIFTLALGIGLMALMFISSRRGFDDDHRSDG